MGQFAVTTGISFGLAGLISTTATVLNDYTPTPGKTLAIYIAVLISHVLVNWFGVHILRYLNNSSIILHSLGVGALAIAVVAKAPTHQTAKGVFATFNDGTGQNGAPGWSERASPAYVAIVGILIAQYTIVVEPECITMMLIFRPDLMLAHTCPKRLATHHVALQLGSLLASEFPFFLAGSGCCASSSQSRTSTTQSTMTISSLCYKYL